MGLIFYEDFGGKVVYRCRKCDIYLTHQCHLLSEDFVGSSGPAELFHKVYNVRHGPATRRHMMTGGHFARDVFCKRCDTLLGWYYELADRDLQQYKEDCTILEVNLTRKETRENSECFHPDV
ncbi:protein yippee-like 5 [Hyalella azteca]|uniref:Protein yippee-like n=1 Tax=Hyalella azteca TaxID=294128 RepID=A0A8B7N4R1_HYAAZ|nr:protein yippee-like 5 [Hyalella azteca]